MNKADLISYVADSAGLTKASAGEAVEAVLAGPLPADVYTEAKRRLDTVGEKPAET